MLNANDSAVHEKWAKFQTKTQKNSEGDLVTHTGDQKIFTILFWDKLGELVYLSVKFVQ